MKSLLTINPQHIKALLDPALGAVSIPVTSEHLPEMMRQGLASTVLLKKPESEKLVSNYRFRCIDPATDSMWRTFANEVATILNSELAPYLELPEKIEFDDLYLTYYLKSEMGVGPHRDINCKNLVVVLVLWGNPAFYVCKDKEMSESVSIPSKVGELMIMRAPNFLDLQGPCHYVGAMHEGMLQFGMRQYIPKPTH